MTFVLDNGNGKWYLEPKTDHNGTYYEVYAHSDDDTLVSMLEILSVMKHLKQGNLLSCSICGLKKIKYMNGVVKISTHIGWKEINANGVVVGIIPDYTENGKCYKDLDAWYNGNPNTDIIYVGEYELEKGTYTWTKNKWLKWVRDIVSAEIPDITDEEIDYIALNILLECDWQDLSTYLNDWEWYDAILEMRKE